MDRICPLPDSLLLKILSLLPNAEDVVDTMVVSKRWQPLWKSVPKLAYDDSYRNMEYGKFSRFVDRSLILHEAPIETLHFKLGQESGAFDIGIWITIAVGRSVRALSIDIDCSSATTPVILPRSLYTGCSMLVTLKLKSVILADVSSLPSFSILKTLSLLSVKYPGDDFVKRLLSSCHVLEDLVVERCHHDNVTVFTVIVPSLKTVSIYEKSDAKDGLHGFVIDAPLLEIFDIHDYICGFCVIDSNMPNIVKADVDVTYTQPGKIMGSITSVKHLYLCLSTSKDAYPVGSVIFHRLVHLKLCTCETEWLNLLMFLLKDSPNLRSLKLELCHPLQIHRPCWSEPSSVPECLSLSLETLEWVKYEGAKEEKELAAFILRNAKCLKKATISSNSTDPNVKLEMIKTLSASPRCSPSCELIFD